MAETAPVADLMSAGAGDAPVLPTQVDVSNEKVLRILQAAHRAFAAKGYHGASMKDIAEEAGVSKSMLHYYFESKNHLLLELHAYIFNGFAQMIRENVRQQGAGPRQAMRAMDQLWEFLRSQFQDLEFLFQMLSECTTNPRLKEQMAAFYAESRRLIVWGIETVLGDMAQHLIIPKESLAALLLAILDGLAIQFYLDPKGLRVEQYLTHMKRIFWQAIPTDEAFPG